MVAGAGDLVDRGDRAAVVGARPHLVETTAMEGLLGPVEGAVGGDLDHATVREGKGALAR